jgi:hypothetical protein
MGPWSTAFCVGHEMLQNRSVAFSILVPDAFVWALPRLSQDESEKDHSPQTQVRDGRGRVSFSGFSLCLPETRRQMR